VQHAVYFVDSLSKAALLEHLLENPQVTRALVFTRTKRRADQVTKHLSRSDIAAEAIHSNKSQSARMRALKNFKEDSTRVLVASDIAARGIDVDQISHVINYDLPDDAHTYVHRIGRTGRAGAEGQAVSFCSGEQRNALRDIERLIGKAIPVLRHSIKPPTPARPSSGPRKSGSSNPQLASARSNKATQTQPKAASPTQQKNEFWRSRRKPCGSVSARSNQRKRRSR
jgi:ATP-dependent RNA helicase RhlE